MARRLRSGAGARAGLPGRLCRLGPRSGLSLRGRSARLGSPRGSVCPARSAGSARQWAQPARPGVPGRRVRSREDAGRSWAAAARRAGRSGGARCRGLGGRAGLGGLRLGGRPASVVCPVDPPGSARAGAQSVRPASLARPVQRAQPGRPSVPGKLGRWRDDAGRSRRCPLPRARRLCRIRWVAPGGLPGFGGLPGLPSRSARLGPRRGSVCPAGSAGPAEPTGRAEPAQRAGQAGSVVRRRRLV
ncbi:hypothetical protein FB470_005132 [Amycolatopsis thermophila]|uniref:Uncharacterized protein n=1 Tax=Amycolatopsis thermophila TaxID=206084 RepID=A0ABU0F0P5_9PSEU|nr:hypothetical protein [Amycolatopsis thermophila]